MDELKRLLENAGINEIGPFDDMPGSDEDFAHDFGGNAKSPKREIVSEIASNLWNFADGDPYVWDAVMEKVHAQLLQMMKDNPPNHSEDDLSLVPMDKEEPEEPGLDFGTDKQSGPWTKNPR